MCDLPPCARVGCGHTFDSHAHYRLGDECALCNGCPGYERPSWRDRLHLWWLRILG